jgi:MATE family multidrug resistance protein
MCIVYLNVERLGQPEELLPLIKPYYSMLLLSLVFIMIFNAFKQFFDSITDTRTSMWVLLGGNLLNVAGNYLLINGKWGFPEWGLLGAGVSTLFSRIVMVMVFVGVFVKNCRLARYRVGFFRFGFSFETFRRLNTLGWPVSLQIGMETSSFSLSAVMIGWLGTVALASHQIMCTVATLAFLIYYGMGAAVAVRVSHFKGQYDSVNIRRSAYAGFHLIMMMAAVFLIMLFLFKHPIAGLFTDNEEVRVMVVSLVFPMLLYQFGDGLQISFANALRGISDVKPMIWIAFIAYFVISLPVGYFFGFVLGWGIVGVWMAFPFGLTSAGVMLWYRFQRKQK